ncbi:MAG: alpha/beta fold hydrolase [Pseudonocardiales bacterium]|nr:alpha/beta fold hydrolase [Hyphomicrobiales bacterium]MBV8825536.1 alpha/beta fold hydrolase [Hyphomicrobiales bacterium]MBV9429462.1 alpha/beta fold hydrolase [Bradyrhizobiaceae bacterium]MBV9728130.1 alpha/beta fold hydrolase [Pseudonocardiales bacterium]
MNRVITGLACAGAFFLLVCAAALLLVASAPPAIEAPRNVFDFTTLRRDPTDIDLPTLRRYPARDGEQLAYRYYDSIANRILIFVHGSTYHSAGYHALASFLSLNGAAKVVLPNLRGHFQSGRRRGDIDYIGQLEDDLVDLIQFIRDEHLEGPITLGGHSSGGGLAIRFAGGPRPDLVSNYLLLSPIIPGSPSVKEGTAGGWASLHRRRLYGLLFLDALGIHGFDGLPIITFNKPVKYWDGTETLSYSYRLNVSYHPRYGYADDIEALGDKALVLVGVDDEAVDADALRALFASRAPHSQVVSLAHINHFGIFTDRGVLQRIAEWLRGVPSDEGTKHPS